MLIVRAMQAVPPLWKGTCLALGNFDGVHVGHQAVISAAIDSAEGAPVAVGVFEPHPRAYFAPHAAPFRLQSPSQRARALAACGVECVFEIAFDTTLAAMTPDVFACHVLHDRLGAKRVIVGSDFRYGKARAGTVETLSASGATLGFSVLTVDAVDDAATPGLDKVSSSAIRDAVAIGDMARAATHLTRPFAIEGVVTPGQQRGRTIKFPTANVQLGGYARPAFGVYAVRVETGDGLWRPGVANCGLRPTISGASEPLLEVHVFDFESDLYRRQIETQLISFLRPERKFDTFEALTIQITQDAAHARQALANLKKE
jgi:riboflavin kinase/FMN adenylyltransferase